MRLGSVGRFALVVVLAGSVLLPVGSAAANAPEDLSARVWELPARVPAEDPAPVARAQPIAYGDISCTWVGAVLADASTQPSEQQQHCDRVIPDVQAARSFVQGLVGAPFTRGIELVLLVDPINAAAQVPAQSTSVRPGTVHCYPHGTFDGDPDCGGLPPEGPLRSATWRCQIQISGDFLTGFNGATQRSALAHELFHCYQRNVSSESTSTFNRTTKWLIEGSAAWVGEVYARGSDISRQWWRQAVTAPGSSTTDGCPDGGDDGPPVGCIFGRPLGYSAHAFFFALAEQEGDAPVVARALQAIRAGGGNEAAMAVLAPGNHRVWLHWAGFGRAWRTGGPSWDLRSPGNNAPPRGRWSRSLALLSGPQVSVTAAPTENKIADVTWNEVRTGEQNMVVELTGTAIARWVDGSGEPVGPEISTSGAPSRTEVCITTRCTSGTDRPPRGAQKIVVAVAGTGSTPSTATVSVECPAPTTSGSSPISALGASRAPTKCCLVGEWQMSQAPIYSGFETISGGAGSVLTIDPDGRLTQDFGPMQQWDVQMTGRPEQGTVHMKLDGALTSTIDLAKLINQRRLRASALDFSGVSVTASISDPSGGVLDFGTQPFGEWFALVTAIAGPIPEENPVELRCSATELQLTDSTSGITHVFTRLSEPVCGGSSCEVRGGAA